MPTEISGSTGVNKIQDNTIVNADINSSAAIAGSKLVMPTGSVLQVVRASGTGETATTATNTWVDTDAQVTITPSSSSSKIYLSHISGGLGNTYNDSVSVRIERNISGGATTTFSQMTRYGYSAMTNWIPYNWALVDLDSPSTTSAITYTFQFKKVSSNGEIRHCDAARWNFIAMEIAG